MEALHTSEKSQVKSTHKESLPVRETQNFPALGTIIEIPPSQKRPDLSSVKLMNLIVAMGAEGRLVIILFYLYHQELLLR